MFGLIGDLTAARMVLTGNVAPNMIRGITILAITSIFLIIPINGKYLPFKLRTVSIFVVVAVFVVEDLFT